MDAKIKELADYFICETTPADDLLETSRFKESINKAQELGFTMIHEIHDLFGIISAKCDSFKIEAEYFASKYNNITKVITRLNFADIEIKNNQDPYVSIIREIISSDYSIEHIFYGNDGSKHYGIHKGEKRSNITILKQIDNKFSASIWFVDLIGISNRID